jgi:hypothetical protein
LSDISLMATPLPRISRWGWRLAPPSRIEVCPPSLLQLPGSVWQRLVSWVMAPSPLEGAPRPTRLAQVRDDFLATLDDIASEPAEGLRQRVLQSLSLRELWHLRADVFSATALAHSQAEAERRLARLNRHFPTRAPRAPGPAP